jgi:RNA polymerase sigma-70 factor (ECF subfamily)
MTSPVGSVASDGGRGAPRVLRPGGQQVPATCPRHLRARVVPADERATNDTPPTAAQLRALVDRYVRAWEAADIAGLVRLLSEDALLAMPPMPSVAGNRAIGAFLADAIFAGRDRWRLIRTGAPTASRRSSLKLSEVA